MTNNLDHKDIACKYFISRSSALTTFTLGQIIAQLPSQDEKADDAEEGSEAASG